MLILKSFNYTWGMEDVSFPRYEDVEIAHQIIDLGADLIIGPPRTYSSIGRDLQR